MRRMYHRYTRHTNVRVLRKKVPQIASIFLFLPRLEGGPLRHKNKKQRFHSVLTTPQVPLHFLSYVHIRADSWVLLRGK